MTSPAQQGDENTAALLSRAVAGDADALSALLAAFGPQVEQSLQIGRPYRSMIEAADVMQVTYLEAFLQINRFRPEQADSFGAWLRRIAENNLRDAIRGLERQKQPPPNRRVGLPVTAESFVGLYDLLAATGTTPSRAVARQEVQGFMQAAIERLPPDYARTVRLYDLENRSIDEVATAMGRSAGAVHMMRARAHERLTDLIGTASSWFASGA